MTPHKQLQLRQHSSLVLSATVLRKKCSHRKMVHLLGTFVGEIYIKTHPLELRRLAKVIQTIWFRQRFSLPQGHTVIIKFLKYKSHNRWRLFQFAAQFEFEFELSRQSVEMQ